MLSFALSRFSQGTKKLFTMYHSAVKIVLLLSFTTLLVPARNLADPRDVVQGLDLKSYNEEQVKGCYYYNETLGICFDIQQHSMELLKTAGENIFVDQDLYPDSFFYQVLDQAFLGVDGSIVYIPKDIPRNREELLAFLALKERSSTEQRKTEEIESTKAHLEEAMSELHYTPEIQLLELVQEALMDNNTQLKILKPFHTLYLHLLSASNVPTSAEFKVSLSLHDHQRQKRCQDMSHDPDGNDCVGMCGKECSCWKFVCGDCCWHQGCYEHDRCCDEKGYFHSYCCSGYGGYPNCLS